MFGTLPLLFAASYLIGSIPFGLLLGYAIRGVDIRTAGSGNIGATNSGRVLGWKWFWLVLLLDFLKGCGPVVGVSYLGLPTGGGTADWFHPANVAVAAGTSAFLGHLFPIFLGFRGGKGVATGLGVFAGLTTYLGWWPLLGSVVVFLIAFARTRTVGLGSVLAAVATLILIPLCNPAPLSPGGAGLTLFGIFVPLLVILKHRDNLRRFFAGGAN